MEAKNNSKTIWAWCMFDWGNQSYNMVITSTIFPAYYVYITTTRQNNDVITFFGHRYVNTVLSNYVLGASYLIVAALLPILTSIADYRGNKKRYLQLFTWLGALACVGLFWLKPGGPYEFGMICFGLASIGYCGGFVFYNSYLPQIATHDQQDAVSAKGFIYGYVGSIVVQIICFVVVLSPQTFGLKDDDMPARISFLIVGAWWLGFSIIPFKLLPKSAAAADSHKYNVLTGGFKELTKVFNKIKQMPLLKRYLSAFFFYSVGVQTIMLAAANFAAKELKMPEESLIIIILVIQADTASYFSFYDVTEKLSIVVGLFCFGFVESVTHQMRNSTLALDGFFAVGLILLMMLWLAENKIKNKELNKAEN